MSTTQNTEKGNGARIRSGLKHNYLGRDSNGDHHHFNRATQTVTVISNTGSRAYKIDVTDLSQWVSHVRNCRGWDDLRYIDMRLFPVEEAI